ncbi:hypothetical protein ACTOV4_01100 [Brucella sp. C7-11G]
MKLNILKSEAEDGNVVIYMDDEAGNSFTLPLSVFDVSTLVSMLYASRDDALKQKRNTDPEIMLPMHGISLGKGDDARQILRVYTTPVLYQDFSPEPGSETETLLQSISDLLAKQSLEEPVSWGKPSGKH